MRPEEWASARRILVVRLDNVGDVILLCSDGIWEPLGDACLNETLQASRNPSQWIVQLDEQVPEPEPVRLPGLPALRTYRARQLLPVPGAVPWRGEGLRLTGGLLAEVGLPAPARAPESVTLIHLSST